MASSSGSPKVCFNSTCKQVLEVPRQGWLCRTGDFADLCDRCASAFKDGKFCDTYHLNASGWRCCESCGKQIHCGCIVSFHMFILLDAGGIECLSCAKREYILTPNPTWPSSSHLLRGHSEKKIRNISSTNWRYNAGSGPVPWHQAPSLFNSFQAQHELQLTSSSPGQSTTDDPCEKLMNASWQVVAPEMNHDGAHATGIQDNGKHNMFKDDCFQSLFNTNPTPLSSLPETFVPNNQKSEKGKAYGIHVQQVGKQCFNNNRVGPSLDSQARNTKAQGETRARHPPLPRYWPQFTDQELQQVSGGSSAKITPLFVKVLSASDAGKIGRLVLPKKCAELYLPPISQPEGYPLVIQDLNGKDWLLQYRFWPNNNSRMYVLEGVTPFIQSMQLQAGDTVTFSRLEPSGKLIMGFRKASIVPLSYKVDEATNTRVSTHKESSNLISEVDKFSNCAKRKKGGKLCSKSIHYKLNEGDTLHLSVTLEQVQGLLRPSVTNSPTTVLIDGVEFEDFKEAPIIGSPTEVSINSDCTCVVCIQAPGDSKHEPTCNCNVCVPVNRSTPPPLMTQTQSEKAGNSVPNPAQSPYADIIRHARIGNSDGNENGRTTGGQSSGIDPNRERPTNSSLKSQKIDLNIQPEQEEECSPVSESMGIMRLVEESTQRYMKLQKLSINGIIDGN